ncbi:glycosyltransferase family A protein [Actinopolymorpha sp. B11F2]|uniref:glycosyltransferase n=1 Tax=Actinopolymorpha sp. B11F2 TaxID=3160862 RepID=UPI0032E422C9
MAKWRRAIVRIKRTVARTVRVRMAGWDTVEVSVLGGLRSRRYRLTDPTAERPVHCEVLLVQVPDGACLERLTGSCLLRGRVREVRLEVATMPTWLRGGLRPVRIARDLHRFRWESAGNGVAVRIGWRKRRHVGRALTELSAAVLRSRRWEQAGGELPALDRAAWIAGDSTWPHGLVGAEPTDAEPTDAEPTDAEGQTDTDPPTDGEHAQPAPAPRQPQVTLREFRFPLVTALANPHGRRLTGRATAYDLRRDGDRLVLAAGDGTPGLVFTPSGSVEATLLDRNWQKYAVAAIGDDLAAEPFTRHVLAGLAACGVGLASVSAAMRQRLAAEGHQVVEKPETVDGLPGYQLSASTSRQAGILADPAFRGRLALPMISVLVASKRADDVVRCLADLARQTYSRFEVLVGTHGYTLDPHTLADLRKRLPGPLRTVDIDDQRTLGEILEILTRRADGEFVAKVDDDDRYGPDHLTDLVLAARTSGADLVAKSARFVHLADSGVTIDRTWAATEAYEVMPAGGTLLLSRGVLQAAGGWSTSPRHVDADLLARLRSAGGVTYRTHGLGYVYYRRSGGHTWQADPDDLLDHGEVLYDGLPEAILWA